jgi:hypothetical protein
VFIFWGLGCPLSILPLHQTIFLTMLCDHDRFAFISHVHSDRSHIRRERKGLSPLLLRSQRMYTLSLSLSGLTTTKVKTTTKVTMTKLMMRKVITRKVITRKVRTTKKLQGDSTLLHNTQSFHTHTLQSFSICNSLRPFFSQLLRLHPWLQPITQPSS